MSDPSWYALWTRSRHEASVQRQLDELRIEAFLPTITKWSRWKDRKKQIEWPLFPGYCFARFPTSPSTVPLSLPFPGRPKRSSNR